MKKFKQFILGERFTPVQLKALKKAFTKVKRTEKRIDPDSQVIQSIAELIKGLKDIDLEKLKAEKIPFVSALATTELVRRKFDGESDNIDEAGRSVQGTLFQAILRVDSIRYVRTGSVEGNEHNKSITFLLNDGKQITINNVYYDKKSRKFYYDEILGVEYPQSADVISMLKDVDVCFRTDKTMNSRMDSLRTKYKVKN